MPWNNQNGGSGGSGSGGGGPWGGGQSPWGRGGGQGGGSGGNGGGMPPNMDDLFRRSQERLRRMVPPSGFSMGGGIVLIVLAAILIWLATGLYRVQPDEQGVVLRFGAYSRTVGPGLQYHFPYPIETAFTPSVTHVNRLQIGIQDRLDSVTSLRGTLLPQQIPEQALMLTGDENIVDINFSVFWVVDDAAKYLFDIRRPERTVAAAAESAMREIIGRTPIAKALAEGRGQIEGDTQKLLQQVLDSYGAGVRITQVQLLKSDPPEQVIEAFRDVQKAKADQERLGNEAESYRNKILPEARGNAETIVQAADAYRQEVVARASGDAQRFIAVYNAFKKAPDVTTRRLYIEAMEQVLRGANKVVVDRGVSGIIPYLPLPAVSAAVPPGPAAPAPATSSPPQPPGPPSPSGATLSRSGVSMRRSPAVNRRLLVAGGIVALLLILAARSLFVVDQTEQAVVLQLGDPKRTIREPGLNALIPFVQNVVFFSRQLLDVEAPAEEMIAADQKRLVVDSYARYRILDPLTFYQTVNSEQGAQPRLAAIIVSSLRRSLGNVTLAAVLSDQRAQLMRSVRDEVNQEAKSFGIEVVDVRIRRADLPKENSQAIYDRMSSERQREAAEARAQGAEASLRIKARADRDRVVILAEAQKQSQIARGAGDAESIAIYADAYNRDPAFFSFYRSMEAYREALGSGTTLLLSPGSSDFMRFFDNSTGAPPASVPPPATAPSPTAAAAATGSGTP